MKDRLLMPMGEGQKARGGGQKARGEGKGKAVRFACLESEEMEPENEEIAANEVNLASRFINLANIAGSVDWGRKNWPKEFSSIIDTGFNGGGLRCFAWLGKYAEYLKSCFHRGNCLKQRKRVEIGARESTRTGVGDEYRLTYLGGSVLLNLYALD